MVRRHALRPRREWYALGETEVVVDEWGEILMERPRQPDADRLARNRERAVRRARRAVADYVVYNGLTKMWTFTYAEKCWDRDEAVRDVHDFVKRWRTYEGRAFPYVWVLEQHDDGSWHAHFAVRQDHYTDFFALRRLWGKGRIRFDPRRRHRGESRDDMRRLANYLTKYLGKDFGDEVEFGRHRYEVAEGFQPGKVVRYFPSHAECVAWGSSIDRQLRKVWSSDRELDWDFPWDVWIYESP